MRFRTFSDNWNFWTVKYLRRVRHNFSLVICVGILLLLQFLIFRSYIGEMPLPKEWPPWWVLLLLFFCGLGTTGCMTIGYGTVSSRKRERDLEHFLRFAPMDANAVCRGFICSHLLTFGILFAACGLAWGVTICLFPEMTGRLLLWVLEVYFFSCILLQSAGRRLGRPDQSLLLMLAFFLLSGRIFQGEREHLTDSALTVILFFSALYLTLLFRESLLPKEAVREVGPRLALAGFLVVALLSGSPVPAGVQALVLAIGAYASMGCAVQGVPNRQLRRLPRNGCVRFAAWVLYGSSAGGWIWSWIAAATAWAILQGGESSLSGVLFAVSWGLAWAEAGVFLLSLIRRRLRRVDATLVHGWCVVAGCGVVLVVLAMIAITFGIDGREVFRTGANWGWAAAAVLLIPNLPRMAFDFRRIVLGKGVE